MYLEMNALGWFPVEVESRVVVGVDIGYSGDNSVAITVEKLRLPLDPATPEGRIQTDLRQRLSEPVYYVRGIVIFPLRTPFGAIIEHLQRIRAVLDPKAEVICDCTGQLSFAEMARTAGLRFTQLMITGGNFDQCDFRDGRQTVSKAGLVSQTEAALEAGELKIPRDLPHAETLRQQLAAFQMGRSPITGQPTWSGARAKDDAVLALSYSVHRLRFGNKGNRVVVQTWSV